MKPTPTESCSKLGETGVSEAHVALLGFDLSKPELRQAFDIGRAKGAARMSECLYQIANGQRSEGSLAATKFFLLNACGWKDVETGPPPKWVPTVLDCMSALEREGVLDEIDREEKARASRAKADHVCPHCAVGLGNACRGRFRAFCDHS